MPWQLSADMNGLRLAQPEVAATRCPACGLFFDYDLEAMDSKRKATPGDLTFTLEFLPIVSPKFKAVFDANGFRGARFKPLTSGQYLCIIERRVALFKQEITLQHLRQQCPDCHHFENDLVTTFEWALAEGESIGEDEIVESQMTLVKPELDCRSRKHLHRLLFIGDTVAAELKKARLRGMAIRTMYSREQVSLKPPYSCG